MEIMKQLDFDSNIPDTTISHTAHNTGVIKKNPLELKLFNSSIMWSVPYRRVIILITLLFIAIAIIMSFIDGDICLLQSLL